MLKGNNISMRERWRWFWATFCLVVFALGISIVAGVAIYSLTQTQETQEKAIAVVCVRQEAVVKTLDSFLADELILSYQLANRVKIDSNPNFTKRIQDFNQQAKAIRSLEALPCPGK